MTLRAPYTNIYVVFWFPFFFLWIFLHNKFKKIRKNNWNPCLSKHSEYCVRHCFNVKPRQKLIPCWLHLDAVLFPYLFAFARSDSFLRRAAYHKMIIYIFRFTICTCFKWDGKVTLCFPFTPDTLLPKRLHFFLQSLPLYYASIDVFFTIVLELNLPCLFSSQLIFDLLHGFVFSSFQYTEGAHALQTTQMCVHDVKKGIAGMARNFTAKESINKKITMKTKVSTWFLSRI